MRTALLALLLGTQLVHAHSDHHHSENPATLGPHVHGAMQLDVVIDGHALAMQLNSPAMDLLGFEHSPTTAEQQQAVDNLRLQLATPQLLFGLEYAHCTVLESQLSGAPFTASAQAHGHADVHAHYQLECANPTALTHLDASQWFKHFAKTEKITVQLITPTQQLGAQLTANAARLSF